MTAHQRTELFKLVASDDLDKKISYKKCEKIAENLNLTLEQVCFVLAFVKIILDPICHMGFVETLKEVAIFTPIIHKKSSTFMEKCALGLLNQDRPCAMHTK